MRRHEKMMDFHYKESAPYELTMLMQIEQRLNNGLAVQIKKENLEILYSQLNTKVYLHEHTNQEYLTMVLILIAGHAYRVGKR